MTHYPVTEIDPPVMVLQITRDLVALANTREDPELTELVEYLEDAVRTIL